MSINKTSKEKFLTCLETYFLHDLEEFDGTLAFDEFIEDNNLTNEEATELLNLKIKIVENK